MGRPPDLHNHKPRSQRLPALRSQPVQTALFLFHLVPLRGPGVYWHILGEIVPGAYWGAGVEWFDQSWYHGFGADCGGGMGAKMRMGLGDFRCLTM